MESIMFNNNHRSYVLTGGESNDEFVINKAILYDDSSFLTHSQNLILKVFKDGVEVLNKHISSYPLKDETGTVAEINEKFSGYKELLVEVYDDALLSDEISFNVELAYTANKPVSLNGV
jgi:hypothetical protein